MYYTVLMKKVLVLIVLLGVLFFIFIYMNNASGTLTQEEAFARLSEQVKGFNEKGGFMVRFKSTEYEAKVGSFVAELVTCDSIESFSEDELTFLGDELVTSGSEQAIHQAKMCWVFRWENMLAGGYYAYVDAYTGDLLAIRQLIEG